MFKVGDIIKFKDGMHGSGFESQTYIQDHLEILSMDGLMTGSLTAHCRVVKAVHLIMDYTVVVKEHDWPYIELVKKSNHTNFHRSRTGFKYGKV